MAKRKLDKKPTQAKNLFNFAFKKQKTCSSTDTCESTESTHDVQPVASSSCSATSTESTCEKGPRENDQPVASSSRSREDPDTWTPDTVNELVATREDSDTVNATTSIQDDVDVDISDEESDSEKSSTKKPSKYQPKWEKKWTWLRKEEDGMRCILCIKHKKSNIFTEPGCVNYRTSTLTRHVGGKDHQQALEAEVMQKDFEKVWHCIITHPFTTELM